MTAKIDDKKPVASSFVIFRSSLPFRFSRCDASANSSLVRVKYAPCAGQSDPAATPPQALPNSTTALTPSVIVPAPPQPPPPPEAASSGAIANARR